MKIWKIAVALTLALGLVIGIALPALAAPPNEAEGKAPPKMIRGKVVSVDEENQEFFTIKADEQEPIKILVNSGTKYFKALIPPKVIALAQRERIRATEQAPESVPHQKLRVRRQLCHNLPMVRQFGEEATFGDIAVDARVMVRIAPRADNPLAKLVLILKPEACNRVNGTIDTVSLEDKTITIIPADGGEVVPLTYNDNTLFRLRLRGTPQLGAGQSISAVCSEDMVAKVVLVSPGTP